MLYYQRIMIVILAIAVLFSHPSSIQGCFPGETRSEAMKIGWDVYEQIRDLDRQEVSWRKISSIVGIHRETVKKYCQGAVTPDDKSTRQLSPSDKEKYIKELIKNYIDDNKGRFIGKQTINISSIHRHVDRIIQVSYMTINRYYHEMIETKP